jgi:phage gpG-like protein
MKPATFMRLKKSLLTLMMRQKDKLFDKSQDPDGNAWPKLHPLVEKKKVSKNTRSPQNIKAHNLSPHKILVGDGLLKNSLTIPESPYGIGTTDGDEVSLGTNVIYAAIHNFGGVIVPKNKSALAFPGLGGGTIFAKKVTIPKRTFMGIGDDDEQKINEKIQAALDKVSGE